MPSAVIIGAGIAGLTSAYHLSKSNFDVTVIEAADHVGGRMATEVTNGYVVDCGAQFLSSAYPVINQLIEEFNLGHDFVRTSPWAATIRENSAHRYSYEDILSPVKNGFLSWAEWFRLGWKSALLFRKLKNKSVSDYSDWAEFDTEYTTDWYNSYYGDWMTEYMIEPVLQGFYFQSPEETSRALPMAVGSFLLHRARTMTLRGGINRLPEALAAKLDVSFSEKAVDVTVKQNSVCVSTDKRNLEADFVVLAVPAQVANALYPQANEVELPLINTAYSTTLNIALGLDDKWPVPNSLSDVYGLLVPRKERKHIVAIAFENSKCSDRSQNGHLINLMLDGISGKTLIELDDESVLQTLMPELEHLLPGISHHIVFQRVYRWLHAEPKSPVGRSKNIEIYRKRTSQNSRVLLAGDYMGMPFTEGAAETGLWCATHIIKRFNH